MLESIVTEIVHRTLNDMNIANSITKEGRLMVLPITTTFHITSDCINLPAMIALSLFTLFIFWMIDSMNNKPIRKLQYTAYGIFFFFSFFYINIIRMATEVAITINYDILSFTSWSGFEMGYGLSLYLTLLFIFIGIYCKISKPQKPKIYGIVFK